MIRKYTNYKTSGIEWIGDIPNEWNISKFKYISKIYNGDSLNDQQKIDFESEELNDLPYISSKDINVNYLTINYNNGLRIPSTNQKLKRGFKGGFLLCIEGGSSGRKMSFLEQDVCFVNKLCYFKSENQNSKFLYYFIRGNNFQSQFFLNMSGLIGGVSVSSIKNFQIPLPSIQEQLQIVQYLDEKTELIDKLISTKEQKIDLLKQQRTSLINEVITKGLDPNVKMKDSGVEWIGEIPEYWKIIKIGHYSRIIRGGSPRPSGDPKYFNGNYIPWITVGEVTNSIGKYITSTETMLTEEGMKQSRVIEPDTLLLSNSGATLGVPKFTKIKGCINDGSVGFLDIRNEINQDYLYYFLTTQTDLLRDQQSGYGQPNLNIDIVSNIRLPLPPKNEQNKIVILIESRTKEIDELVSMEQKKIDLLKEYRQSLISEVITGKIDVRTNLN